MSSTPPPPPHDPAGAWPPPAGGWPPPTGPSSGLAPDGLRRSVDGVSIAAFVCSLTCCAAPVAIGLGIAGLVRTKQGRRTGRWAAVTGLVIGTVLTLAMLVGGIFLVVTSVDDLDLSAARTGECIDLDFADTPADASCDAPHDGEIAWVGQMTEALQQEWDDTEYVDDFCSARNLSPTYDEAMQDPAFSIDYEASTWDGEPRVGSWMICYFTAVDGQLNAPLDDLLHAGSAT